VLVVGNWEIGTIADYIQILVTSHQHQSPAPTTFFIFPFTLSKLICYNFLVREKMLKKFRIFAVCSLLFALCGAAHAATDFRVAAQLLSAAKAGDVKYVEILINAGADVNYVDDTGLSIVCTALMNNDLRAAQILQIYGADASKCDQQIKRYNQKLPKENSGGLFGGLSNAQYIALAAGGAAIVAGGIILLTNVLGGGRGGNNNVGAGGNRPDGGGTPPPTGGANAWSLGKLPIGPSPDYNLDFWSGAPDNNPADVRVKDFAFFNSATNVSGTTGVQNYLLLMRGYSPLARGYMGMRTLRYADKGPFPLNNISYNSRVAGGGKPIAAALITANGINPTGSATDGWMVWAECNGVIGASSGCISALANSGTVSRKYYNNTITKNGDNLAAWTWAEDASFDLSGFGTVFNASATDQESMLAKIIAGWYADGRVNGDFLGFMPNGQLIVYRTGGGLDNLGNTIDIFNYKAMYMARQISDVIANASLAPSMRGIGTATISDALTLSPSSTSAFLTLVDTYYNTNTADDATELKPSGYAHLLLGGMSGLYSPMLIFSTGEYQILTGPGGLNAHVLEATFENAAPIYYANLNHLFMSVVAVQLNGSGTSQATSVTGFDSNTNKFGLAGWTDNNGTPADPTDDIHYGARACGQAGKGTATIDPWCFAAAGQTGEQAVAAAAGAVGALESAFSYMKTDEIFTLMALTADGPFLGTLGGNAVTKDSLTAYLQGIYFLPPEYQFRVDSGEDYLSVFAEVFGYGLINLERATTPGTQVYYYTNNKIGRPGGGNNAYWRSSSSSALFSSTALSLSGAFGSRAASISVPVFDVLESSDGSLSIPRIFENTFSLNSGRRGMYMGDVLGDFKTTSDTGGQKNADGLSFNMSFSDSVRAADNMGGLDELSFGMVRGDYKFGAKYQRHFSDSENMILRGDTSNPILALSSNVITSNADVSFGRWSFGARAFSGAITDESLLENDPTISNMYVPMRLGTASGAESAIGFAAKKFGFATSVGMMHESDTILGAYSDGMLNMGGGDTVYLDNAASYRPNDYLRFMARATVARTTANPTANGFISGLSAIDSDAFSVGADVGPFSFMVSRPLAVIGGSMQYTTADLRLVDADNGYALDATPYTVNLNLRPDARETRVEAAYRTKLGTFTDGALGFIYRVNPNNTNQFGNETILMMKLSHKLGI